MRPILCYTCKRDSFYVTCPIYLILMISVQNTVFAATALLRQFLWHWPLISMNSYSCFLLLMLECAVYGQLALATRYTQSKISLKPWYTVLYSLPSKCFLEKRAWGSFVARANWFSRKKNDLFATLNIHFVRGFPPTAAAQGSRRN